MKKRIRTYSCGKCKEKLVTFHQEQWGEITLRLICTNCHTANQITFGLPNDLIARLDIEVKEE